MTTDNQPNDNGTATHLPQFFSGNRQISLAALREQIEIEFIAETRSEMLLEADEVTRRDMIRQTVDYVLAVETITLSRTERFAVLDLIYRDLFGLGPLDSYLADPTLTEITISGPDRVHVRYGAQEMVAVADHFDDAGHLERVIQGVLSTAKTRLSDSDPVLEVGIMLAGRTARLTVIGPPISPILSVDVRVHPAHPATLANCVTADLMDQPAADLLQAIIAAGHGLMVVGDVGTGKTTLIEALLPLLSNAFIVERAAELRVPDGMEHLAAIPPTPTQPSVSFAEQIDVAVGQAPDWLVIDEVRFDETQAMWRALTADSRPRCLWVFRGAVEALRLRNAFNMSVRRAQPGIQQEFINSALLDRLPFVVLMAHQNNHLKVLNICEWQPDDHQPETLALKPLWPTISAQAIHPINWKGSNFTPPRGIAL